MKARAQNDYYQDLQKQIEEAKAKKKAEKQREAELDILQEQRIQKELHDLNTRERADIAKERGEPVPQAPPNPAPVVEPRTDSRANNYSTVEP